MNTFQLARFLLLRNLMRNRVRTALSVLGVSIGIWALVLVISFSEGVQTMIARAVQSGASDRLITVSVPMAERVEGTQRILEPSRSLTDGDIERLRAITGVKSAFLPQPTSIEVSFGDQVVDGIVEGLPPTRSTDILNINLIAGDGIEREGQIVLSETTVRAFGSLSGEMLGKEVRVRTKALIPTNEQASFGQTRIYTVVGVVRLNSFSQVQGEVVAESDIKELHSEWTALKDPGAYDSATNRAIVIVQESGEIDRVRAEIEKMGLVADTRKEILAGLESTFRLLNIAFGFFGVIILVAAALGIANIMFMTILERRREIGIMRALGMHRRTVGLLFLGEGILTGLIGGLLGILVGWISGRVLLALINFFLNRGTSVALPEGFAPVITVSLFFGALALAALIAGVASIFPARVAASLDTVEALRVG